MSVTDWDRDVWNVLNVDRLHRLWYGPFLWGDGSIHPCPKCKHTHGEVQVPAIRYSFDLAINRSHER
jgi:hypothetical protein